MTWCVCDFCGDRHMPGPGCMKAGGIPSGWRRGYMNTMTYRDMSKETQ